MDEKRNEILVVDDEPYMCKVVSRILEREGYSVTTAPNGETALELIQGNKPDLILLDLMMPGINGREVCRIVRESSPETRIIYFTARVETDRQKLKELRSEADAFLSKPATSKQIISRVSSVLNTVRC